MIFMKQKSFVEKIGTNRRLLDRIVLLDFQKPFDLIPYYNRIYEKRSRAGARLSEPLSSIRKSLSFVWAGREDLNLRPPKPQLLQAHMHNLG